MVVYKITNKVNGKIYIGQTKRTLEQRIKGHLSKAKSGNGFLLHDAIAEYGWDNFTSEILETVETEEDLNYYEAYYIKYFHSDIDGYNLTPGGTANCMDSEIVKQKHDEKMRTDEVRMKISESLSEYKSEHGVSEEHRKHISESLRRFYASGKKPNYKQPQHLSPEHFKALQDSKNKSVYCIDYSDRVIEEFDRVKDAAEWWSINGHTSTNIRYLCDQIKKSFVEDIYIHGIKWVYRV